MGKDACTATPWSKERGRHARQQELRLPHASGLVEIWSIMFETYCLDKANEFQPGKFDVMKEIMPNYEPCVSAPGGAWETEQSKQDTPLS